MNNLEGKEKDVLAKTKINNRSQIDDSSKIKTEEVEDIMQNTSLIMKIFDYFQNNISKEENMRDCSQQLFYSEKYHGDKSEENNAESEEEYFTDCIPDWGAQNDDGDNDAASEDEYHSDCGEFPKENTEELQFQILVSEDYFLETTDSTNNHSVEGKDSEGEVDSDDEDTSDEEIAYQEEDSTDDEDYEENVNNRNNKDGDSNIFRNNDSQESDITLPADEEDRLEIFWESIKNGNMKMFVQYLDAVADINIRDSADSDRTALHKAAITGNKDIINMLLSYGGDIFAASGDGLTPIYYAETGGHTEIVGKILQRGNYDIYSLVK